MLTTDDLSEAEHVQTALARNELAGLENWIFADESPQKLSFEVDPKWYGELPRTYFLNKNNERIGISGALSLQDYETIFKQILN